MSKKKKKPKKKTLICPCWVQMDFFDVRLSESTDVETMATERAELYFKFLLSFWAAFHRLSFSGNVKMAIVNPRVYLVYMCIECSQRASRGAEQGVSIWHSTTIDTTWGWYGPVRSEFSDMLFRQCPFIPECLFNTRFPQGWRGGMSSFFFFFIVHLFVKMLGTHTGPQYQKDSE